LVTNVNEVPTDIALSANTVAENLVINTVVGTLSTTDPDVGDTFNYTLVSGAGSTDNASFNISGSNLRTSAVFDYETKNSYSIRVRSTDTGSLYFEKAFTILVTNVNDAPIAVDEAYSIAEDTTLIVVAPGVLGNDTDPENDPLTAILNVGPAHGDLTLNANGSFVYTPDPNYFGTDSFTYHARDAALNSNIATVTITIVDKLEVFYLPVINR
jgi:VCBS repeat-containing protein